MKLSVWMTTYNHEKYIKQCLESILMQETNFDFDIIIGEDCSTDGTRKILEEYEKKFPGKIKLFLPEKNLGMIEMDVSTLQLCTGSYLALLNGDDYWTSPDKLQIQVDFMDANPDSSMCYHKAKVINEIDGSSWDTEFTGENNFLPVEKLFKGFNPIMTSSVVCRNIMKLPDWYSEVPYGDMPLYLLLAQSGNIGYMDKVMSVYRISINGNWQGDKLENNLIKDVSYYNLINEKFDFRYDKFIKKILAQRIFDLIVLNIKMNDLIKSRELFKTLSSSDTISFIDNEDVVKIKSILFEKAEPECYPELINRQFQWHVN
ncbi:MAG: glycosyltransferase [Ignavibacteria bacterium]